MPQARHVQMLIQQSNSKPLKHFETEAYWARVQRAARISQDTGFPAIQHVDASRDAHSGSTASAAPASALSPATLQRMADDFLRFLEADYNKGAKGQSIHLSQTCSATNSRLLHLDSVSQEYRQRIDGLWDNKEIDDVF